MNAAVLFIDDDVSTLDALRRVMMDETYEILTAESAVEAAQILSQRRIDVIVTDENMPGMSGTEMLVMLARTHPDVVAIVLTGSPSMESAMRSVNSPNVVKFFTKPCNYIDLAVAIRAALESRTPAKSDVNSDEKLRSHVRMRDS